MDSSSPAPLSSLSLTHVVYDSSSHVSLVLALITLSPILLMACYASLSVYTRELLIINMWAGQLANEAFNWVLKKVVQETRPETSHGDGYGFPSSHSQYMGFFSSFFMMHLLTRHRFPNHTPLEQRIHTFIMCLGALAWAGTVCYSRYHLTYHTPHQIIWGAVIGVCTGTLYYGVTEFWPALQPNGIMGRLRSAALDTPIARWARIRDGWAVWPDGGKEDEYEAWRKAWSKSKVGGSRKEARRTKKEL